MDEFTRQGLLEWQSRRSLRRRLVWLHALIWAAVNGLLYVIWNVTGADFPWFVFPLLGWLVLLVGHAGAIYLLRTPQDALFLEARRRDALH